jgi:cell fate (sporulation/competence/biofilm development) regulator YlbF (YheA/YmcA/DUF963 family)
MSIQLKPTKYIRGEPVWDKNHLDEFLASEMLESNEGGNATRTIRKMNQMTQEAIDTFDASTDAIVKAANRLEAAADKAQANMKAKVSQLKDYQSQLTTAITNVNKTVNEKQLEHLVINSERLVSALQALDALNKQGALEKILNALGKK